MMHSCPKEPACPGWNSGFFCSKRGRGVVGCCRLLAVGILHSCSCPHRSGHNVPINLQQDKCCYDPAIPLLGVYPEKTIIQKDTCTPVFTAALFTIARAQKQPKCPSTDEWIKKMWYTYTMEYYSAIKRNETESFVETWMNLETLIQSEVSQKEKNEYRILTHICGT